MEQKKKKKNSFCPHWVRTQENSNSSEKPKKKKKKKPICFMLWAVCVSLVESSIFLDLRAFFA